MGGETSPELKQLGLRLGYTKSFVYRFFVKIWKLKC
jgi:hypothetical protein